MPPAGLCGAAGGQEKRLDRVRQVDVIPAAVNRVGKAVTHEQAPVGLDAPGNGSRTGHREFPGPRSQFDRE